jgi:hypothetical protein
MSQQQQQQQQQQQHESGRRRQPAFALLSKKCKKNTWKPSFERFSLFFQKLHKNCGTAKFEGRPTARAGAGRSGCKQGNRVGEERKEISCVA